MQAIILAGGMGTRLKPFTNVIPKPLVPLGDQPILEIVLRQLKSQGFDRITIAVNHLARLIQAFFGDGSDLGLEIAYSQEDKPLGTAGPIRLIPDLDDTFLVMNGDILTTLDYGHMFESHVASNATASIATFRKDVKIDLGVLETDGDAFKDYIEKPTYHFDVSMGIYALSKKSLDFMPDDTRFDMPDLMLALRDAGHGVRCHRGDYEWLDIGRIDDYETAVAIFDRDRAKYLAS